MRLTLTYDVTANKEKERVQNQLTKKTHEFKSIKKKGPYFNSFLLVYRSLDK